MTAPLRIPTVLAFTVIGVAVATSAGSCDRGTTSTVDAKICLVCVYDSSDNGNCPFPTCATGPGYDICPAGCVIQPTT